MFWLLSGLVFAVGLVAGWWARGWLGSPSSQTRNCRVQTEFVDIEAYWEWSAAQIKNELKQQSLDKGQLKGAGIRDLVRSRMNGKVQPLH